MKRVLAFFVFWLFVLNLFMLVVFYRFRITTPDTAYSWLQPTSWWFPAQDRGFVSLHVRWDSGIYVHTAFWGYSRAEAAFFPLYPLTIQLSSRAVVAVLGITSSDYAFEIYHVVALVISIGAALGSTLVLYKLARLDGGPQQAQRSVFYFLIFPGAFILTVIYSEALFLFFAISCLFAARRGYWWRAGILGGLAALTRNVGIVLLLAVAYEFFRQPHKKNIVWELPSLALIPLGTLSFLCFLQLTLGDYHIYFESSKDYGRFIFLNNWDAFFTNQSEYWHYAIRNPAAFVNLLLDVCFSLVAIVTSLLLFRERVSYALYALGVIGLSLGTGSTSLVIVRFALAAFPVFLLFAKWGRDSLFDRGYTLVSILGLGYYIVLWVQGYWIG